MLDVREFIEADRRAVITLWQRCGLTRPWNDPSADIDLAIGSATSTILVGTSEGTITASVMAGFDGHRGWVYYLAVDPDHARCGHGRTMMAAAEDWLAARSAPKLELMVRNDNDAAIGFYEALGYEPQKVSVLAKWIDGREKAPRPRAWKFSPFGRIAGPEHKNPASDDATDLPKET